MQIAVLDFLQFSFVWRFLSMNFKEDRRSVRARPSQMRLIQFITLIAFTHIRHWIGRLNWIKESRAKMHACVKMLDDLWVGKSCFSSFLWGELHRNILMKLLYFFLSKMWTFECNFLVSWVWNILITLIYFRRHHDFILGSEGAQFFRLIKTTPLKRLFKLASFTLTRILHSFETLVTYWRQHDWTWWSVTILGNLMWLLLIGLTRNDLEFRMICKIFIGSEERVLSFKAGNFAIWSCLCNHLKLLRI